MNGRTLTVLVALLSVTAVTGATAFTTASVARTATVDVANDANGVIGLESDPDVTGVSNAGTNGALAIDLGKEGTGNGLNVEGEFSYGDGAAPTSTYAFNVTNRDSQAHDLTFGYVLDNDPNTNVANVEFTVYDAAGSQVATVSDGGSATVAGVGAGTSHYVVVTVDTTGVAASDDLSGTLTVDAA